MFLVGTTDSIILLYWYLWCTFWSVQYSHSQICRIAHLPLNLPSKNVSARYVWGRLLRDVTRRCKKVVEPLICFCHESDRIIIP
jgi:hypothetical protein